MHETKPPAAGALLKVSSKRRKCKELKLNDSSDVSLHATSAAWNTNLFVSTRHGFTFAYLLGLSFSHARKSRRLFT